jgi:hypothetical protein
MLNGLYMAVSQLFGTNRFDWYRSGNGGTGGTSGELWAGLVRGVPKLSNSAAAARPPSSVPEVPGR